MEEVVGFLRLKVSQSHANDAQIMARPKRASFWCGGRARIRGSGITNGAKTKMPRCRDDRLIRVHGKASTRE